MQKETAMAKGIIEALQETPPDEALTALCLAAGLMTAQIELATGENLLPEALRILCEARDAVEKG